MGDRDRHMAALDILKHPPPYVLPVMMALSWMMLLTFWVDAILVVAAIYELWSIKNIILGPLKQDAGVVTHFLVAAAQVHAGPPIQAATCALLSANYGYAIYRFRTKSADAIAKKLGKTSEWVSLFFVFLYGMCSFWAVAVVASLFPTPIELSAPA